MEKKDKQKNKVKAKLDQVIERKKSQEFEITDFKPYSTCPQGCRTGIVENVESLCSK